MNQKYVQSLPLSELFLYYSAVLSKTKLFFKFSFNRVSVTLFRSYDKILKPYEFEAATPNTVFIANLSKTRRIKFFMVNYLCQYHYTLFEMYNNIYSKISIIYIAMTENV